MKVCMIGGTGLPGSEGARELMRHTAHSCQEQNILIARLVKTAVPSPP